METENMDSRFKVHVCHICSKRCNISLWHVVEYKLNMCLKIIFKHCIWVNVQSHPATYWPCSVEVKAGRAAGVWWAQTCLNIPSPAGTAAGPWGPAGAHLQGGGRNNNRHADYEWTEETKCSQQCSQDNEPYGPKNKRNNLILYVCSRKTK